MLHVRKYLVLIYVGLCYAYIFKAFGMCMRITPAPAATVAVVVVAIASAIRSGSGYDEVGVHAVLQEIVLEILNNVPSTPSGKPIQLCLHIDNYHTESFVFKFNLTSFATHRRITNSASRFTCLIYCSLSNALVLGP